MTRFVKQQDAKGDWLPKGSIQSGNTPVGTFALDADYSADFVAHLMVSGYLANGIVRFRGKPIGIFEAHGLTLPLTTEVARQKAEEVVRRLKALKVKRRPANTKPPLG
jgi:hypothetical protein